MYIDDQDGENSDDVDPCALPEFQDLGPKWSGKTAPYLTISCLFYLIVEIPAFNILCSSNILTFAPLQNWMV